MWASGQGLIERQRIKKSDVKDCPEDSQLGGERSDRRAALLIRCVSCFLRDLQRQRRDNGEREAKTKVEPGIKRTCQDEVSDAIMGCNMCVVKRPEEQYRIMFQVRNLLTN